MSKQKESCSIKGCRRRFDVLYLRKRFCSWHWAEECNRQDEKEREAMDAVAVIGTEPRLIEIKTQSREACCDSR